MFSSHSQAAHDSINRNNSNSVLQSKNVGMELYKNREMYEVSSNGPPSSTAGSTVSRAESIPSTTKSASGRFKAMLCRIRSVKSQQSRPSLALAMDDSMLSIDTSMNSLLYEEIILRSPEEIKQALDDCRCMKEFDEESLALVHETWDLAKRLLETEFRKSLGSMVMERLTEIQPRTRRILSDRRNSSLHALLLIASFDAIFEMLGKEDELIEELLKELAGRHYRAGVNSVYIPFMARALVDSLRVILGGNMRAKDIQAWWDVLDELTDLFVRYLKVYEKEEI